MLNPTSSPFASADRELDGQIAERLFGWRWFARETDTGILCAIFHPDFLPPKEWPEAWYDVTDQPSRPAKFKDWYRVAEVPGGLGVPFGVPPFSTDHNAAALVLARLNELGFVDQVGRAGEVGTQAVARFKPLARWAEWTAAVEETRPLAICRAAMQIPDLAAGRRDSNEPDPAEAPTASMLFVPETSGLPPAQQEVWSRLRSEGWSCDAEDALLVHQNNVLVVCRNGGLLGPLPRPSSPAASD